MSSSAYISFQEAKKKLETYCAYQERCHTEVINKLYLLKVPITMHDEVVVHLITNNFLNEERYAQSFTRGKHRLSHWGKRRITQELKYKGINQRIITIALSEIDQEEYRSNFLALCKRKWENIKENDLYKKKQKIQGYLYRKGYELEDIINTLDDLAIQE